MPRTLRSCLVPALSAVCLFALFGCGVPKGSTLKGNVVFPPYVKLVDGDSVVITFVPDQGPASVAGYQFGDQSFVSQGPAGKGVPPGKYKVVLQITANPAPNSQVRQQSFDGINQAYSATKSPLTYEVTSDPDQSLTIDFAKGTVTKK